MARLVQNRETLPEGWKPIATKSRRDQAIDAAAHVFARFGYHGAGTRAIASVLGIKVASLYSYFISKDAALEEVCQAGLSRPYTYLLDACEQETTFDARIRKFFVAHKEHLEESSDYVSVYMNERRYLPPDATARLNASARKMRKAFDNMFIDAREEGSLHPEVSLRMARLILIGFMRNITQFYLEGPIEGFSEFVDQSAEHFLRGIRPSDDAHRSRE